MNWMMNLWTSFGEGGGTVPTELQTGLSTLNLIIFAIINVILGLLGVAAALFFVWIGFKLARAEDESKRKEAKKQMLFAIIAVLGVVVLIVLWNTVLLNALQTTQTRCFVDGNWTDVCPTPGTSAPYPY